MVNYQHDVEEIPFNEKEIIVIAADNNGAIGMKPLDEVRVDYQTVGYYAFRVAYMECVAAGGNPFSIVIHNFNAENAWYELIDGINRGLKEVGLQNIPITGSTETNFELTQSALGLVVLGKKNSREQKAFQRDSREVAIIGKPLVGQDVIDYQSEVAPLWLYKEISEMDGVDLIRPISSKGIKHEVTRQINLEITYPNELDEKVSSGPGTSFLVVYDSEISSQIQKKAGNYLQMIRVLSEDK